MSTVDKVAREKIEAKRDAEEMEAIGILRKRLEGSELSNGEIHTRVIEAYGSTNPKATQETRMRVAEEALGLPSLIPESTKKPAAKRVRKPAPAPAVPAPPEPTDTAAEEGPRMVTLRGKR